jgi:hypothetical protein
MMGYFMLHDLAPDLGGATVFIFMALAGVFGTPVVWIWRWIAGRLGTWRPPLPPTFRLLLATAVLSSIAVPLYMSESDTFFGFLAAVYFWVGFIFAVILGGEFLPEGFAFWLGDTVAWAGVATVIWWMMAPARRYAAARRPESPEPIVVLESEVRSQQDACDQCRAAAALAVIGAPLVRIAHTSEGPRFLYRCRACHSYWLKEIPETRVISVVRARQLFPNAVG